MPAGDGTGPAGMGPMTGRAAGYCAGYSAPGYMNPVPRGRMGYGRGPGRGYGYGFGRGFRWPVAYPANYRPYPDSNYAYGSAESEAEYLENAANSLKAELDEIQKRLEDLKDKD